MIQMDIIPTLSFCSVQWKSVQSAVMNAERSNSSIVYWMWSFYVLILDWVLSVVKTRVLWKLCRIQFQTKCGVIFIVGFIGWALRTGFTEINAQWQVDELIKSKYVSRLNIGKCWQNETIRKGFEIDRSSCVNWFDICTNENHL